MTETYLELISGWNDQVYQRYDITGKDQNYISKIESRIFQEFSRFSFYTVITQIHNND